MKRTKSRPLTLSDYATFKLVQLLMAVAQPPLWLAVRLAERIGFDAKELL
jgi:hypothetical protein